MSDPSADRPHYFGRFLAYALDYKALLAAALATGS
jgi:hypothetical protein